MSDRFQRGAYHIVLEDALEGATPHDCDTGMTCCDGCAHTGHMFQDLPENHAALAQQAQPRTDDQIREAGKEWHRQDGTLQDGRAHMYWENGAKWYRDHASAQQAQPDTSCAMAYGCVKEPGHAEPCEGRAPALDSEAPSLTDEMIEAAWAEWAREKPDGEAYPRWIRIADAGAGQLGAMYESFKAGMRARDSRAPSEAKS
jgi:hypothetical protein